MIHRSLAAALVRLGETLRIPFGAVSVILATAGAVVSVFCLLKSGGFGPIDVTAVYYVNATIVYGLWGGFILIFMVASLRRNRALPLSPPRTRFLCLIPAHNERDVIANPVRSLLEQDYPRSLFEVVVIDDGHDDTAAVAQKLGAAVLKTPRPGTGKHPALAYAIRKLVSATDARYVCVFDADNVIARDFLEKMNNVIVARRDLCLQGFHDVLNPRDNWVTKAMWCGTLSSSRLYNQGRFNVLGSSLLCGTGWCCIGWLLRKHWPEVKTQTEDIELNGLLLLGDGVRVSWVHEARFFDEKPRNLWVAIRQRRRWMIGHMRSFRHLAWPCVRKAVERRDPVLLEMALYYGVPFYLSISVVQLFGIYTGISLDTLSIRGPLAGASAQWIASALTLACILVYQSLGFGFVSRRWLRGVHYGLYSMIFSLVVWPIALVWAWFSVSRSDWISHTPHVTKAPPLRSGLSRV